MDTITRDRSSVPTEVELKVLIAREHLDSVRDLGWLRDLCHGRPVRRHLVSTYFDTVDETLLRRGVALRVRRQGRKRMQTIKADQRDAAGLFRRLEWESAVEGDWPDLEAARAAGLGDLLEGVGPSNEETDGGRGGLRPVCATDIHRTEMRLIGEDWAVTMALDRGTVSADGREEAVSEIELELSRGTPGAVYTLAERLADTVPMRLGRLSKAERALALARGAPPPQPVKAEAPALTPDMSVGAAFQAIGRACLAQMAANEPALLETQDPEAVHQMRVAVRRLRSAMTTFGAIVKGPGLENAKTELRWLMSLLGPARDIDVFLADILDPVIARFPDDQGLARLRALFTARRAVHYREALAGVGDTRFTRLALSLGAWIEAGDWLADPGRAEARAAPLAGFARATLERRRRKVWKAGRRFDHLAPEARHDLRILVKKLRYTAEFFAGLFGGKAARPLLKDLARLQDQLGALNDVAVAGALLHDTLAEHRPGATMAEEAERAWGAGLVTGWHRRDAADALEEAGLTWARLRKRRLFWTSGGRG